MMADYIPRETVKEHLKRVIWGADQKIDCWINDIPAADVVPWEWLEQYAEGRTPKSASKFIEAAKAAWEEKSDG